MFTDDTYISEEIPPNSLSCMIGRIVSTPDHDEFIKNGELIIDFNSLDGSVSSPDYGEDGSVYKKGIASWTLRAAMAAWNYPPKIKFKGRLQGKGKITLSNVSATLSNVTITGGAPLQGTTSPTPGIATVPVTIAGASGSCTLTENQGDGDFDVKTDDDYTIELTAEKYSVLPWCTNIDDPKDAGDIAKDEKFIKAGDKALCLAFGNSTNNLYVVDIIHDSKEN